MTIEKAREICKLQLDGLMSNPQVTLDPEYIKAERMAIACMNALEEIRQETVDAIEDGLYVRNMRILDIIDKHFAGEKLDREKIVEKIKAIIKKYYGKARCGCFDCCDIMGDKKDVLYRDIDNDITVLICYNYSYFEVYGLTDSEFAEVFCFYKSLCEEGHK